LDFAFLSSKKAQNDTSIIKMVADQFAASRRITFPRLYILQAVKERKKKKERTFLRDSSMSRLLRETAVNVRPQVCYMNRRRMTHVVLLRPILLCPPVNPNRHWRTAVPLRTLLFQLALVSRVLERCSFSFYFWCYPYVKTTMGKN